MLSYLSAETSAILAERSSVVFVELSWRGLASVGTSEEQRAPKLGAWFGLLTLAAQKARNLADKAPAWQLAERCGRRC